MVSTNKFLAFVWREGDFWVAQCVHVNIASCGTTKEEAKANLVEAIQFASEPPEDSSFLIPAGNFQLETVTFEVFDD